MFCTARWLLLSSYCFGIVTGCHGVPIGEDVSLEQDASVEQDASADHDAGLDSSLPEQEPQDTRVLRERPTSGCGLDSGWDGDDACLEVPDPDEGFQLHFGPSGYDDPEELARFILEPGTEALLCAYIIAPNDQEIHYNDWQNSLRPGSHHMTVHMVGPDIEEASGVSCRRGGGASNQGLVGGNTTTVSPLEDVAPENEGLARTIPAHSGISMQLHFFNVTEKPLLMEAWQNIYYMDEDDVKGLSAPMEGFAGLGMSVKPGTTEVIRGAIEAPQDLRLLDLYSHNHDHTLRFSAYLRRKDQDQRELIYESYDWEHPLLLPLDSIHENNKPNREKFQPGGHTGILELKEGDIVEWECEIANDDLDEPLTFANKAHEGEMCIVRGNYEPSFGSLWSIYLR